MTGKQPRILRERFRAGAGKWAKGAELAKENERWRDLYDAIEDARAAPTATTLRALAKTIRQSGALEKGPAGEFLHIEALDFHVTARLAIAELLLSDPKKAGDRDLAEDLIALSNPPHWVGPYLDAIAESAADDGDPTVVADLLDQALEPDDEAGPPPREVLRALRAWRREFTLAAAPASPEAEGPSETDLPLFLTAEDMAPHLRLSVRTVNEMLNAGEIPNVKHGRNRLTPREDFLEYMRPDKPRRRRKS